MSQRPWFWQHNIRRGLTWFMLVSFVFSNYFPMGMVWAAPDLFSRPGAGISRLPLEVMAFDAPGFGDLEQAINLASGNLYVGAGELGYNNLLGSDGNPSTIDGDEEKNTIGNGGATAIPTGWNYLPRVRLEGFTTSLTKENAPSVFFLAKGDGSGSNFKRVYPSDAACDNNSRLLVDDASNFSFNSGSNVCVPSWIQRYKNIKDAVVFYALFPETGLQYAQEWIVLVPNALVGSNYPVNGAMAFYYQADGNRYAFNADGQYADFVQSLHQQYRGAKAGIPNGRKVASASELQHGPMTDFWYDSNGNLTKIKDEWKRVTLYRWSSSKLDAVYYLTDPDDEDNINKWIRKIELGYEPLGGSQMLTSVKFLAKDGLGATSSNNLSREIKFHYTTAINGKPVNGAVMDWMSKRVLGSAGPEITYNYEYFDKDSPYAYRIKKYSQPGEPATFYTYDGFDTELKGPITTVTQDLKRSQFHYDNLGQLRKKTIYDLNPNNTADTTGTPRTWKYEYYKTGNLGYIEDPSGKISYFIYDNRGNLKTEAIYQNRQLWTGDIRKPVYVAITNFESPDSKPKPGGQPAWATALGSEFTLTVEVRRDIFKKGVSWRFKKGAEAFQDVLPYDQATPQQRDSLVTLISQADPQPTGGRATYTVRATFRAPTQRSNYTLEASSKLDTAVKDTASVNISPRIRQILVMAQNSDTVGDLNVPWGGAVDKLIVAPNCIRPRMTNGNYGPNNCLSEYRFYGYVSEWAEWVKDDYKTQANQTVEFTSLTYGMPDIMGYPTPALSLDGRLTLPYLWFYRSSDYNLLIKARSKAEPWVEAETFAMPVGYFGLERATNSDFPDADWDPVVIMNSIQGSGHTSQFLVKAVNSPGKAADGSALNISWQIEGSAVSVNSSKPGCFNNYYSNQWFGDGDRSATLTAYVDKYPDVKTWEGVTARWGSGSSEACTATSAVVNGFGANTAGSVNNIAVPCKGDVCAQTEAATVTPQAVGSGLRARGTQEVLAFGPAHPLPADTVNELPSDLTGGRSQFEYAKLYAYDSNNRLKQQSVLAEGRYPIYKDVIDYFTYTEHPQQTSGQQDFTATSEVKKEVKWGFLSDQEIEQGLLSNPSNFPTRSTLTESFLEDGRLRNRKLTWDTKERQTTLAYWSEQASPKIDITLPNGTTLQVHQYGDLVYSATTTATGATSRTLNYKYDALGNPVEETLAGVVKNAPATGSSDFGTRKIERAFNGFGQPIWERLSLGSEVHGERGWEYYASGELKKDWVGETGNATTYEYYSSGSHLGRLKSKYRDHSRLAYEYDSYGRVSKESEEPEQQSHNTTYEYDTLDRPTKVTYPDGYQTQTWYDAYGQPATIKELESGNTTPVITHTWSRNWVSNPQVANDNQFTEVEEVTPATGKGVGYKLTRVYDEFGRITKLIPNDNSLVSDAADRTTYYTYDSEGHLLNELGPVLRSNTSNQGTGSDLNYYTDARRASLAYTYDNLGRKTEELRVLYGVVSAENVFTEGAGRPANEMGDAAKTQYEYDGFDQILKITDAENYTTQLTYDTLGQVYRSSRQVGGGEYAVTHTAFDAAGHPTKVVDPRGYASRRQYDKGGNLLAEINQNDYVVKRYTYTADGLLQGTYEPKFDVGDSAKVVPINPASDNNFVLTQWNMYGQQRPYPTQVYAANQDNAPTGNASTGNASGGVVTSYEYNWQGKPTKIFLPNTPTATGQFIERRYDHQGNVTYLKDADGFVTESKFDFGGRLLEKKETGFKSSEAGLPNGLTSTYLYDAFGNLTQQNERGVVTNYVYNSLGKVIAESRSTTTPLGAPYKKYAYRLDGAKLAETSYTYLDGTQLQSKQQASANALPVLPATTGSLSTGITNSKGNLTLYKLDKLGNIVQESSQGFPSSSGTRIAEKVVSYTYNGLGLRTSRDFQGYKDIYQSQRDPNSGGFLCKAGGGNLTQSNFDACTDPQTDYKTYWYFNLGGKLVEKWDEVPTSSSATSWYNYYYYEYSPTGKETWAYRELKVPLKRMLDSVGSNTTLSQDPLLAGSVGGISTGYNERDLVSYTNVYDSRVTDVATVEDMRQQRNTNNAYYFDGSLKLRELYDGDWNLVGNSALDWASVRYEYDARGRETKTTDNTGTSLPRPVDTRVTEVPTRTGVGKATITTEYLAQGVRKQTVTWAGGTSTIDVERTRAKGEGWWQSVQVTLPECSATTTTTPTVGGLSYQEQTSNTCFFKATANPNVYTLGGPEDSTRTLTYNAQGLEVNSTTVANSTTHQSTPVKITDANGTSTSVGPSVSQTVTRQQISTTREYNPDTTLKKLSSTITINAPGDSNPASYCEGCDPTSSPVFTGVLKREQTKRYDTNNGAGGAYSDNGEGYLVGETSSNTRESYTFAPASVNGQQLYWKPTLEPNVNVTYDLDSRGNRLAVHGTQLEQSWDAVANLVQQSKPYKYDGYRKRYDAEDRAAMYYRWEDSTKRAAYSDFLYDPFGQQTLSSSATFNQDATSKSSRLERDYSANYYSNGEIYLTRKNKGQLTRGPTSCSFFGLVCSNPSNEITVFKDVIKDQTFSLADGLVDETSWQAAVLFEVKLPSSGTTAFQAPETPKNQVLKQPPLEVKPAGNTQAPGSGSTPTDAKPPTQGVPNPGGPAPVPPQANASQQSAVDTAQPASSPTAQGQQAGTIQTLSTGTAVQPLAPVTNNASPANPQGQPQAASPAPSNTGKDASGVQFQAPDKSPLPPSVEAVSPQGVATPNQTATPDTPGTPDPTQPVAPGTATPPPTSANPQDGPLGVVAPSSISVPKLPPVSPNDDPKGVNPPEGIGDRHLHPFEGEEYCDGPNSDSNCDSYWAEKAKKDQEERARKLAEEKKKREEALRHELGSISDPEEWHVRTIAWVEKYRPDLLSDVQLLLEFWKAYSLPEQRAANIFALDNLLMSDRFGSVNEARRQIRAWADRLRSAIGTGSNKEKRKALGEVTEGIKSMVFNPEFNRSLPNEAARNWLLPLVNLGFEDPDNAISVMVLPKMVVRGGNGFAAIASGDGDFAVFGVLITLQGAEFTLIEGMPGFADGAPYTVGSLFRPGPISGSLSLVAASAEFLSLAFDPRAYNNKWAAAGGIAIKHGASYLVGTLVAQGFQYGIKYAVTLMGTTVGGVAAPITFTISVAAGTAAGWAVGQVLDEKFVKPYKRNHPGSVCTQPSDRNRPWRDPARCIDIKPI